MLTKELNEKLTRIGPGTPMGKLFRRYWQPIAGTCELDETPTKKIRLLGEDLVVYRDKSGNLGLIQEQCPHRGVSLEYGILEKDGLRCQYHGWCFNNKGQCTDQPGEPRNSTYKDTVKITAYPVQEQGGLIFAYLGPEPVPLLPRYDMFVWENAVRTIGRAVLPCNWLQVMENSVDPVHAEWLHGHYAQQVGRQKEVGLSRHHVKIDFDKFEYGIIKRRLLEGQSEDVDDWQIGHPLIFPNMLRTGGVGRCNFQIRVPADDYNTLHFWYTCYLPDVELPEQKTVPIYEIPYKNENGKLITSFTDGQDIMAWITQGPIADRTTERLGSTDKGIILYRKMLQEEMAKAERGEDPIGVIRDPQKNHIIEFRNETEKGQFIDVKSVVELLKLKRSREQFNPKIDEIVELFEKASN